MPLLDVLSLQALSMIPPHECKRCGRAVRKNYCRQCDEFFEAGHLGVTDECLGQAKHDAHRTY